MSAQQPLSAGSDAQLMELIAAVTGDLPPAVAALGRAVYTWRTVDEELRELQENDKGPAPPPLGAPAHRWQE